MSAVYVFAAGICAFASAFVAGRGLGAGVQRALAATRGELVLPPLSPQRRGDIRIRLESQCMRIANAARRVLGYYLRNGAESLQRPVAFVLSKPAVARTVADAVHLLQRRGVVATCEGMASVEIAALVAVAAGVLAVSRSMLAAVLAVICTVLVSRIVLTHEIDKERELLREQVPDALRCMEACLHAGLSLPQTFNEVAQELAQPAKEPFAQVTRDLDMGCSMSDALVRFRSMAGLPELAFVAMALDVQYACGGSATPVLRAAEDSIARGLDLRRSLRVQTAQARLSAQIVAAMPFLLLFVISAVSPGFLSPFFQSSLGVGLLACAIAMQAAGMLLVRRVLAMEV